MVMTRARTLFATCKTAARFAAEVAGLLVVMASAWLCLAMLAAFIGPIQGG